MLRGLALVACVVSACAARPEIAPKSPAPAPEPELALTALADAAPAAATPRPRRRVGRLSPPFALGAPARNVLARAPSDSTDGDLAAR